MIDIRFQSTASAPNPGRLTLYGRGSSTHMQGIGVSCLGIDPVLVGIGSHVARPACGHVIRVTVPDKQKVERDGFIMSRRVLRSLDVAV